MVERYQRAALQIASRLSPSQAAAQDLVQEAFLEAYLSLWRLRDPERFKSWLFGILLNLGRNRLRRLTRNKLDNAASGKEETLRQSIAGTPDLQQVAEERELHRLVFKALEELTPAGRQAVLLYYFEYLSVQEIAVLLGVSVNAIKVRLHRARTSLRQVLETRYPEFQPLPSYAKCSPETTDFTAVQENSAQTRRQNMLKVSILMSYKPRIR